jgi:lipoprotein-anchoring transpeptidase ErfK/SrfK
VRSSFKRFSENRVRRRRLWLLPVLFLLAGLSFWGIKTLWTSESATAGGGQKEKDVSVASIAATAPAKGGEVWVKVVKSSHTLYLYEGDKIIMTAIVAVGENPGDKQRAGDRRTPEGEFVVEQIQNSSYWKYDFGDGPVEGAYGPWFIRLKTGWQGIGIHGTHDESFLGKDVTEGCIRMKNEDLEFLKSRISIGTRVVIEP